MSLYLPSLWVRTKGTASNLTPYYKEAAKGSPPAASAGAQAHQ